MTDEKVKIIPDTSPVSELFREAGQKAKVVVFSGLPGVGKSLYIREFKRIASENGRQVEMIQWDVARKSFETEFIMTRFPMQGSTVHNGLKLSAGLWLMDFLKGWLSRNNENARILVIEAPLVGHRFAELVHKNSDRELERFLESEACRFIVPIPTRKIRKLIEEQRRRQVSEDASVWSGAKPSVMLQLWKDTCMIANEFGMDIDLDGQPPYSDGVYEYVYSVILRHRNFDALIIDEVFEVPVKDESFLHDAESIRPTEKEAEDYAKKIEANYSNNEIDEIVERWYAT